MQVNEYRCRSGNVFINHWSIIAAGGDEDNPQQLISNVNVCSGGAVAEQKTKLATIFFLHLFTFLQHLSSGAIAFNDCMNCVFPIHYEKLFSFVLNMSTAKEILTTAYHWIDKVRPNVENKIEKKENIKRLSSLFLCTFYGHCDRHFALASEHIFMAFGSPFYIRFFSHRHSQSTPSLLFLFPIPLSSCCVP